MDQIRHVLVKIHVPGLKKKINHYTTKINMSSKVI